MTLGELWRRIVRLVRRNQATAELEEEMKLHIELRRRATSSGEERWAMGDEPKRWAMGDGGDGDAAAAARRRFGNRTLHIERSRDEWGFGWAEQFAQDVRYAARRLTQRPGFALAVILVMALGIGATTAMFSAVDAALLRPLPFAAPEKLVTLNYVDVPSDFGRVPPERASETPVNMTTAVGMSDVFSSVAAYAAGGLNLADADRPVRIKVGVVTRDFFATLGVLPAQGRVFSADEGVPGGPKVAVLSYALWQRQFGGRAMLGQTIPLNGKEYTVIGVMPARFSFPRESELWIPMSVPVTFATFEAFRGWLPSTVVARTAQGVSVEAASAKMMAKWGQFVASASTPERRKGLEEHVADVRAKGAATGLQETLVGDRRTALLVLLGATGLLLLIACTNVTNLLLAHAGMRRREIAVREVLGATRGRVLRQLLTESMFLALAGAALGVLVAPLAFSVMRALMPVQLAGVSPAQLDWRVVGFAAALALATGVGFGLWPALGSTRVSPGEAIKAGGGVGSTIGGMGRARRVLVGAELALTLMLLVGAGLMMRSFSHLMGIDRGMDTEHVATLELAFSAGAPDRRGYLRMQKMNDIVERLTAVPGITSVGMVNDLPLSGAGGISISVDVPGEPKRDEMVFARLLEASPGYFPTMGIRILRGRAFTVADDSAAPKVVIVSAAMEKAFWAGKNALGRTLSMMPGQPPTTVVGIAADVREGKLENNPNPQMYFPIQQGAPPAAALVARGTLAPALMLARLREAVRVVDPSQAVYNVRMMDDVVSNSVAPRRANTLLISAFAALALLLAALGVYAVVSYGVTQRAREFGIRSALGATGRDLVGHVAGEMVPVTLIGVAVGLGGAWAFAQVLNSLVFGVDVHDPVTFAVVPLALVVPVVLATLVPARRAMRVNPAEVIRVD